ncbi:MAG: DNA polymerase III subunit delta [Candidatus Saccharimonadales bacterium]
MITTLTGNNHFALKKRLDELITIFIAKNGPLALERIDAEETDLSTVMEAVSSLPFLTDNKMAIIHSLGVNKPASEHIEQIIDSVDEATKLIFYEPSPDKRTSYFKVLKKRTSLEEYNELAPYELAKWLVEEAKNQGGYLSLPDANYLVERAGVDHALLSNELDKLLSYEPKISRENIVLLTEPAPQSRIFDLLEAAFKGQKRQALELYAQQRAQKVEPQAILAMIAWQLQLMAYAKYSSVRSVAKIAKDTGVNAYPLTKAQGLGARLSDSKFKEMVGDALEIDRLGKTSVINMDEALKTYIVSL